MASDTERLEELEEFVIEAREACVQLINKVQLKEYSEGKGRLNPKHYNNWGTIGVNASLLESVAGELTRLIETFNKR